MNAITMTTRTVALGLRYHRLPGYLNPAVGAYFASETNKDGSRRTLFGLSVKYMVEENELRDAIHNIIKEFEFGGAFFGARESDWNDIAERGKR